MLIMFDVVTLCNKCGKPLISKYKNNTILVEFCQFCKNNYQEQLLKNFDNNSNKEDNFITIRKNDYEELRNDANKWQKIKLISELGCFPCPFISVTCSDCGMEEIRKVVDSISNGKDRDI